jgi:CRISPR system Cascade subunit CasE
MYLSRLILNPRHRRVQRELARPYELHRTVLSAFGETLPPDERVLYRVDTDARSGQLALLVQSQHLPDWRWADGLQGYLLSPAQCKSIELALTLGQVLSFRLRANPTVKKATHQLDPAPTPGFIASCTAQGKKPDNGVRLGLAKEEDQRAWLARKGTQHGFRVLSLLVVPEGLQKGQQPIVSTAGAKRERNALSHLAVRFEGLLQVADPTLLAEALRTGIGSAKGFGFGLLSLAPARVAE